MARFGSISSAVDLQEQVEDWISSLLVAGEGITLAYNDAANTLTITATAGGNSTVSTSPPSGGSDGDVWYQVVT